MRKAILIGILLVGSLLALALFAGYWVALAPNTTRTEAPRSLYVPRGASFAHVMDSLRAGEMVRNPATLTWAATVTGWGDQVKAGHYYIDGGMSNYDLLQKLRRGLQDPIRLLIPPGTRPEVVAAVAGRDMAFSPEEFLRALQDSTLAAELGVAPEALFGYMLPETYHFYWLTPPDEVIRRIKQDFDRYYEAELAPAAETSGLAPEEVVTLASIVEWEAHQPDERPVVAGVYRNRLRIGMKLDADPTIQYILLQREGQKRRVLYADLRTDHPYNTYLRAGLPPGPITNPSKSSLKAAAIPATHDYLYFVADGTGGHAFSRTLAEHNQKAARYHALMRERRSQQRAQEPTAPTGSGSE